MRATDEQRSSTTVAFFCIGTCFLAALVCGVEGVAGIVTVFGVIITAVMGIIGVASGKLDQNLVTTVLAVAAIIALCLTVICYHAKHWSSRELPVKQVNDVLPGTSFGLPGPAPYVSRRWLTIIFEVKQVETMKPFCSSKILLLVQPAGKVDPTIVLPNVETEVPLGPTPPADDSIAHVTVKSTDDKNVCRINVHARGTLHN